MGEPPLNMVRLAHDTDLARQELERLTAQRAKIDSLIVTARMRFEELAAELEVVYRELERDTRE